MIIKNKSRVKNYSKPIDLPQRQYFPLYSPNFGNFYNYIELPDFIDNQYTLEPFMVNQNVNREGNNNSIKKEYKFPKPHLNKQNRKELVYNPDLLKEENLFEKYSDLEFYVNSMIDKIVYSKFPIQGKTIALSNHINLNKINDNETKKHSNNEPLPDNTFGISKIKDNVLFESRFESGNLHSAFQMEDNSYQLVIQNDTNTNGYNQWFFFRIQASDKKTVKMNIINMSQKYSLFCEGMRVSVYSESIAKNEKIGWHREGVNIKFYKNGLYKFIGESRKNYCSLCFDYNLKYPNDNVYFAMNIPFTYTKMNSILNDYSRNEKKYK